MFGGPFRGPHVVNGESGDPRDLATDSDNRFAKLPKSLDFVIADEKGESYDRVHPFSYEEVIKQGFTLVCVIGESIESEIVACTNEGRFNPINRLCIKPSVDEGSDNSNVPRTPSRKAFRCAGGNEAKFIGGFGDSFLGFPRDRTSSRERA